MPEPRPTFESAFRTEVATFRAAERRRCFPMGVHAGAPDGPRRRFEVPWPGPAGIDQGLRFDLAASLVDRLLDVWPRHSPAWGWLTRPGVPEVHDHDLGWLAASVRAFDAHGLPLAGFRAVTRTGWLDLITGESRTWKRLRS